MARYELADEAFMSDEPEPPFAVIEADDDGKVTKIEVHPQADEEGQQIAADLIEAWTDSPEDFPLNRLAVSYGSLKKV